MGLGVNCGAKAGVSYYRELTHVAMTQRYYGPGTTPSSPFPISRVATTDGSPAIAYGSV